MYVPSDRCQTIRIIDRERHAHAVFPLSLDISYRRWYVLPDVVQHNMGDIFLCFCHFHIWCLGSGVILDYIDSSSLPSSLLYVSCAMFV